MMQRENRKLLASFNRIVSSEKREITKKLRRLCCRKESTFSEADKAFIRKHLQEYERCLQTKTKNEAQRSQLLESEDSEEELMRKCKQLKSMLTSAAHVVAYTGAGISTAAAIPDYRGPNGVWTKLQQGEGISACNIAGAEPTYSHMCIAKLVQAGIVRHVVSQNCDGLHLRSGIPCEFLSEIHGNMFIEVCTNCQPQRTYRRLFDVTERTNLRRHLTGRTCDACGSALVDSIVHFGEKRSLDQPQNWQAAFDNAKKADLLICFGSSLKVLKSYHGLWSMHKKKARRPKLCIVNLQWTPKDKLADLKLNAKCDTILGYIMVALGLSVPSYSRPEDPIFSTACPPRQVESAIHSTLPLEREGACSSTSGYDQVDDGHACAVAAASSIPGWFGKGRKKPSKASVKKKIPRLSSKNVLPI